MLTSLLGKTVRHLKTQEDGIVVALDRQKGWGFILLVQKADGTLDQWVHYNVYVVKDSTEK